jgi:hypothetical protein
LKLFQEWGKGVKNDGGVNSAMIYCMHFYKCHKAPPAQQKYHNTTFWGGKEEVAQTMYTHVSKCKHDEIKGEKNKNFKLF